MTIILVWRSVCMPSEEKREASLSAPFADLNEALAWETAARNEHRVLLHA